MVRVFMSKMVMSAGDEFFDVELYTPEKKLKKDIGYIIGEYVYVYRGKEEQQGRTGIYKNLYGDQFVVNGFDLDEYHIDNINELDPDRIFEKITDNEADFIVPEDVEIIQNNAELFKPPFREDDDFLKYIVKRVIWDKNVNMKNYRNKFTNQFTLNNMMSGLKKSTKMTVTNFKIWGEVLGFDWEFVIRDNGTDKHNPLPDEITVESGDF